MSNSSDRSDLKSKLLKASAEQLFAAFSKPDRVARWWGPDGFSSTMHQFEFVEDGIWRLTLHSPDGGNFENEYRVLRIEPNRRIELDHPSNEHHFVLSLEFQAQGENTLVHWQQRFDSVEHYAPLAEFLAQANEQVLARLEAEALRV